MFLINFAQQKISSSHFLTLFLREFYVDGSATKMTHVSTNNDTLKTSMGGSHCLKIVRARFIVQVDSTIFA